MYPEGLNLMHMHSLSILFILHLPIKCAKFITPTAPSPLFPYILPFDPFFPSLCHIISPVPPYIISQTYSFLPYFPLPTVPLSLENCASLPSIPKT